MSNKIPRTIVLTLRETPVRTRVFMKQAAAAGIAAEPFYGIWGRKTGLTCLAPNVLESDDPKLFMTEGAIGCFLSHLTLWKALSLLPEDEFFIVEDDAVFVDGFTEKFQAVYSALPPNWQFAYVGWNPYGNDFPPLAVEDGLTIRLPAATHAYLVKKSTLDLLCDSVYPIQSPLDLTLIHRVLPKLTYYVFDPSLVVQQTLLRPTDPVWTSLVYDWKNDLYGFKKTVLKELILTDGWFGLENSDTEYWRWSGESFTVQIPTASESITLVCASPIENNLTITVGGESTAFPLKPGKNEVKVKTNGGNKIVGVLSTAFVPIKDDPKNQDSRTLGVSLSSIIMNADSAPVEVSVSSLGTKRPQPMSLKLNL